MKVLYTGDSVDNLKDTDVSPGLWGVILFNNWTKILEGLMMIQFASVSSSRFCLVKQRFSWRSLAGKD